MRCRNRSCLAHSERVEAELVAETADVAGHEASLHEQRPQISRVVIHLVVVHLIGRAAAQSKRGEFEEVLAAPRRDVDQSYPAHSERPVEFGERSAWIPQMFQHRVADEDVNAPLWNRREGIWKDAFYGRDLRILLQRWVERDVEQGQVLDAVQQRAGKPGLVAA